jgi:hypothetical protein
VTAEGRETKKEKFDRERRSFTVREEYALKVLEKKEGAAGPTKVHVSRFIKSRIITVARYVVHMGDR